MNRSARVRTTLRAAVLALSWAAPLAAAQAETRFITLGTAGGPVIRADRSQPANLLMTQAGSFLVDAGDGAIERLAAAGLQPRQVDAVFISHLHVDHIGGLQGLIGIRWMLGATKPLVIYGPPGTDELVRGLVASLAASARIGLGFGKTSHPVADSVRVITVHDGDRWDVGSMHVKAIRNTHFTEELDASSGEPLSLAFRFDCADRSIGYTGDTGPAERLAPFFTHVDLLVSEVIDLAAVVADSRRTNTQLGGAEEQALEAHLSAHHLTAQAAGELATSASATELVLTHLAIPGSTNASEAALTKGVHSEFSGKVAVARDMQVF